MIDVQEVLKDVPHFDTFCSLKKLEDLVERLRRDPRFAIEVAGESANGIPIHCIRFGSGNTRVLFAGGTHCPEQVGSLTVFSLLQLLSDRNRALIEADVEWYVVPCIDPDGALLNEGWSQKPFTLETYLRNYYEQAPQDQVDRSFPVHYKQVHIDKPSKEARVLQGILDRVKPDFFCSLHNYHIPANGAWFTVSRDIGQKYYEEFYALLKQHGVPLRENGSGFFTEMTTGVFEMPSVRKSYEALGDTPASFGRAFEHGVSSYNYLETIKEAALTFVVEIPYVKHPSNASKKETGKNLQQLKLQIDADNKFLATAILDQWATVEEDLDPRSPFYRKIFNEVVAVKDRLREDGIRNWCPVSEQDILSSESDGREATESELFETLMSNRFRFLYNAHVFVRLLKTSSQSTAVTQALAAMERIFDAALRDLAQQVDFDVFEAIDCDALAKIQLGCGLVAINSLLEHRDVVS